ncbi:MAG: UDP-N-acetylmuramoyl-L-alanyl-D-glutamate--2,6-diaminopimelate ligase [Burkholderiales bacterium]|nr:UDP-N-acetylmuramoyl-L-alanyl-D-glutamate--2,6-diaminopimelate ligase [Burkholderiales bacterium]
MPAARGAQTSRFSLRAVDALGVRRLATDSRRVRRGDTFVAYPGETRDGRDYIPQAIANGAASVLWESGGFAWNPAWRAANLGVTNLRRHAGEIASHVYGRPSAKLWMIGITGTNGKTSCSQWIAQCLTRTGRRCAVIGTLGCGFPGALEPSINTTPDAVWLHAALREFLKRGARGVSMEVSSHGLAQHRLSGIEFDVALLTNLTRDHLDYHGTMRSYRAAKAKLFRWPSLKCAVLNLDDNFGVELATRMPRRDLSVLGYGFGRIPAVRGRKLLRVQGRNLHVGVDGLAFDVSTPWGSASIESRLIGRFNAANLLGSLATLLASEVSLEDSVNALQKVKAVAGRTECYGGGRRPLVVIDYAHTPDALEKVLIALRELIESSKPKVSSLTLSGRQTRSRNFRRETLDSKLVCVFGCGGDRDRGKRPLMGRIASRLADHVIITNDNPRSEDPLAIIADILEGVEAECAVVPDRARAIRQAVAAARRGDVVLIAGKGHERHQEIRGVKHPFNDAAVAQAALRRI